MHFDRSPHAAAACLLLLAGALPGQSLPEFEPNDTAAQAQNVPFGAQIDANLVAGEQDWYTFVVTGTQEVHCQTSGQYVVANFDLAVFLYDATGTTLLAWDDSARPGLHADAGCVLGAGTYTCKVIGKNAGLSGDYGFEVVLQAPGVVNTVEAAEPNNSPASGGTPTPFTMGDIVTGFLAPFAGTADSDWWSFTLVNRGIVLAQIDDDASFPQCDNQSLRAHIEASPGTWVSDIALAPTVGHRVQAPMRGAPVAGTYAWEVVGAAPGGSAPFNYTRTGNYSMRTQLIDMPGAVVVAEPVEPNSSPVTAGLLSLGDSATGSTTGNDQDWFAFQVTTAPRTLGFITQNGVGSPIVDTSIRLYDAAGNLVSAATPSGSSGGATDGIAGSLHGRLILTVLNPGTYYVSVEAGPAATGTDYVLHTGQAAPMRVSSSITFGPSANGCVGSNALIPTLDARRAEVPQLESLGVTRVSNALPSTVAVAAYGFSNSTPGLPLDLTFLDMPGCFLRIDPVIYLGTFLDGAGTGYFEVGWLSSYSTIGQTIYMQAFCFDPLANLFGFTVTNEARYVLGDRGF